MRIKLSDIIIDPEIQLKERGIDDFTVTGYVEAITNGAELPPVIVFQEDSNLWLSDGFHRVSAYRFLGLAEIEADVRPGTRQDAMVFAATANVKQGRPMSQAQKREAGERLLRLTDWSQERIARELAVDRGTVSKWKTSLEISRDRVSGTRNGSTYLMDTSNIGQRSLDPLVQPHPVAPGWSAIALDDLVAFNRDNQQDDVDEIEVDEPEIEENTGQCWNCQHHETDGSDYDRFWCAQLGRTFHIMAGSSHCDGELWEEKVLDYGEDEYGENEGPTGGPETFNYKRDTKSSHPVNIYEPQGLDACQTPAYAIDPLLPYLDPSWVIWEPAAGEGNIVEALYDAGYSQEQVVSGDLLTGQNFFDYEPPAWDCLVTNPPYSIKFKWLERCYELGKPFALLLPVETLGTRTALEMFEKYGIEWLFLKRRVDFKMPLKGWDAAGAQFPTLWVTYRLTGQQITIAELNKVEAA